jgi:hypothetical protein
MVSAPGMEGLPRDLPKSVQTFSDAQIRVGWG